MDGWGAGPLRWLSVLIFFFLFSRQRSWSLTHGAKWHQRVFPRGFFCKFPAHSFSDLKEFGKKMEAIEQNTTSPCSPARKRRRRNCLSGHLVERSGMVTTKTPPSSWRNVICCCCFVFNLHEKMCIGKLKKSCIAWITATSTQTQAQIHCVREFVHRNHKLCIPR